ncbi:hypothetical protein [Flavobacterium rhizosphaerae]|uniref:Uncharacterized protein n=1 Tax=Flavobacterium rhizosphaerae TaxID=3163298 RepID=A0ABW8YU03_9FLAO
MEHYFILLQLPGKPEDRFCEGNKKPHEFWHNVADMIQKGKARIISQRQDTGVSEEFRGHIKRIRKFKTYIILNLHLDSNECLDKKAIFKKAARWISNPEHEVLIETSDNFQLVSID